jgi:hypothetical protein
MQPPAGCALEVLGSHGGRAKLGTDSTSIASFLWSTHIHTYMSTSLHMAKSQQVPKPAVTECKAALSRVLVSAGECHRRLAGIG